MTKPYPPLAKKLSNILMLGLTGACALLVVSVLFFILGYLIWNGARSLNLAFFTKLPVPVGSQGGGMANAMIGSGKLLLLASVIGLPIGVLGGIYLAEFGRGPLPSIVRYTTDLLNGVPSIVMGIFVYTLIVLPQHHFSTLAGGVALGIMMIPIALRSTEEFLRSVPHTLREGGLALGASKAQTRRQGHHSCSHARDRHWNHAGRCTRCGRDGATPVHRLRQSILEPRMESTHGIIAGHDLQLCDFAL